MSSSSNKRDKSPYGGGGGSGGGGKGHHHDRPKIPVLIITDVGKDVDDTLALLYLARQSQRRIVNIVGVVTTGGRNAERAQVARELLDAALRTGGESESASASASGCGCDLAPSPQSRVEIVAGSEAVHDGTAAPGDSVICWRGERRQANEADDDDDDGDDGQEKDAVHFILDLCRRYCGSLRVLALAPLTDLAAALRFDASTVLRGVKSLHIQGQAILVPDDEDEDDDDSDMDVDGDGDGDGDNGSAVRLEPDPAAFNLRCEMDAARYVFAQFQRRSDRRPGDTDDGDDGDDGGGGGGGVPIILVGKHAAYAIPLTHAHFQRWDNGAGHWTPHPRILRTALDGIEHLGRAAPETFERVFRVPATVLDGFATTRTTDEDLAAALPHISCPYDVVAAMTVIPAAIEKFFDCRIVPRRRRGRGGDGDGDGDEKGVSDILIGNAADEPGVRDAEALRTHIVGSVSAALSRGYTGSGGGLGLDDGREGDENKLYHKGENDAAAAPSGGAQADADDNDNDDDDDDDAATIDRPHQRREPLVVCVGTSNGTKLRAVRRVCDSMEGVRARVAGVPSTSSGVPGQPVGGTETFGGALNRARSVRTRRPDADVWIGLENGLISQGV
eukprot:CAMPEP_0113581674 /NCGR_PEP_ID=MMETSP0015_2-20120614/31444_1 /TAXON_ID=2838 /ORGANISM="Odontella" /LENGTH=616 /DNA_ID=CAMNT_0000486169 /DNA_START=68 /DNA_END=1915 /DNA_ORIENTATION=- /assembly_acc=CAM_ASM_000160